jgi:DNA polymerase IV
MKASIRDPFFGYFLKLYHKIVTIHLQKELFYSNKIKYSIAFFLNCFAICNFFHFFKKKNLIVFFMKIHIDLDCFFVSAERTLDPSLLHKPVAVGGKSDSNIFARTQKTQGFNLLNSGSFVPSFYCEYTYQKDDLKHFMDADGRIRGILTTASYEARRYGIKTAMSIAEALTLCPQLIVKTPHMSLYQKLSRNLYAFLQTQLPLVEQASIDEFYGDLSGWVSDEEVPEFIDALRHRIQKIFSLPVSIGAARTRYIAKLATTAAKPFGCKTVYAWDFDDFINPFPVSAFPGIGRSMLQQLDAAKINTLGELRQRRGTVESWGIYPKELYRRVNGESDAPVNTHAKRKSIGISRTFEPVFAREEIQRRIIILARHLHFAVQKHGVIPTRYALSIRYELRQEGHSAVTKRKELTQKEFKELFLNLFRQADIQKRLAAIRLSLSVSEFTCNAKRELSLLEFDSDNKQHLLTKQTYKLQEKYGLGILRWASEI